MKATTALDKLRNPPTTEGAMARLLFKTVLGPETSKEKIQECLDERSHYRASKANVEAGLLLSDNIEHGVGCLDEKDFLTMNGVIKEHRERLKKASANATRSVASVRPWSA